MPGTSVRYNGAELINVFTKRFSQEPVYDQSGTDLMYHKFIIRVESWVHSFTDLINVPVQTVPVSTDIVYRQTLIREALMHPRGDFQFIVGDSILLQAGPLEGGGKGNTLAVDNGPKPRFCEITQIAGYGVFRIEFEIEVCVVDCAINSNNAGILSNRWSLEDQVDQDWYTTRTIQGRLVLATVDLDPQSFRGWVVPPLQLGFRRESMYFATSADGLILEYTIIDKQVHAAAPYPSTSWDASHTVSTGDGINKFAEVVVSLKGPPGVDKRVLIQLGAQIMQAKLGTSMSAFKKGQIILDQAAIVDRLSDSSIDFRVRVRSQEGADSFFSTAGIFLGAPLTNFIPNYLQFESLAPGPADLASPLGLWQCYLQSPCNDQHQMPQFQGDPYDMSDSSIGQPPQIYINPGSINIDTSGIQQYVYDSDWSQEQRTSQYTFYRIRNTYEMSSMKVQLPVAGASGGQLSPSGSSTIEGTEGTTDNSVVVTLARSQGRRVVYIEGERAGDWPTVQEFDDLIDTYLGTCVILKGKYENEAPKLMADGVTRHFISRGTYVYALPRPPEDDEFKAGEMPWMDLGTTSTTEDNEVPKTSFSQLL